MEKGNFWKKKALTCVLSTVMALTAVTSAGAISVSEYAPDYLVPVGKAVGISISFEGAAVVSASETSGGTFPARDAGIQAGDVIVSINGVKIHSSNDIKEMSGDYDGSELKIEVVRKGKSLSVKLRPYHNPSGGYELGMWLRDSMAGLGTVTFYDPETGYFGALGHGVNDSDSGTLVSVRKGSVGFTGISEAVPGKPGFPGQLRGKIEANGKTGEILQNTDRGIFGRVSDKAQFTGMKEIPTAEDGEIKVGQATILCDVGGGTKEYCVEISRLYLGDGIGSKNMLITVTDEALLNITGGIVQGMSGSPIIQNGKLIGAVTHVLINTPQKGYGITIQNMLYAAGKVTAQKAA